jgi:septal ring factor EnvC (AmiA/AmiB activator)
MKHVTIIALCFFLISLSMIAFADQPAQVNQPEQDIATEAAEEDQITKEAARLPSTLITDEEAWSKVMREVEELKSEYVYEEDLMED